ncbi:MAG TPA: EAL domain-containing protein [Solirubrobacteraceae bacterium]|nr:EAL domain-containing protein [Solirubrobacteraceae bacterium]
MFEPAHDHILFRRFVEASRRAEIVTLVNSAESQPELGEVVSRELCEALEAEVGWVLTTRGDDEPAQVAGSIGLTSFQRAGVAEGAVFGAPGVRTGIAPPSALAGLGLRVLALASFHAPEGRALLAVGRLAAEPFDEAEIALLDAIARSTGQALRRVWLTHDRTSVQGALADSEAGFRLLAENSTDWISRHDTRGHFTYCSPACESIAGYAPEELVGRHPLELVHPDDRDTYRAHAQRVTQGETVTVTFRVCRRDGGLAWAESTVRQVPDPVAGAPAEVQAATRDVTARIRAEERLRLESSITATMAEGVCLIRPADGQILYANPTLERMFGYRAGELNGRSAGVLGGLPLGGAHSGELRTVTREGASMWCHANVSTFEHSEHGPLWVTVLSDITDRKLYEAELEHLVSHEPLTGLLNRRRFEEELAAEIARARRYGTPAALLALDLDNFKFVNDSLGHQAGDRLIVAVAELLRRLLRRSDVLARLGGDEFAILLPRAGEPQAREVAHALQEALRAEAGQGLPRRVTASIGVALLAPYAQASAEDVLMAADIAMYDAKEGGRDRVAFYDPLRRRHTHMEARLNRAEQVRRALDEERLVTHAQPVLSLTGDPRPRHELLVRLRTEDGSLLPPVEFLAVAERFGLIQEVDRWVARQAIGLLAAHQRAGHALCLEVNLSARSLSDLELVGHIEREVARTGADPRGLVFEITETAAIDNLERAQLFARRLAALGCELALDDFGAGFASFASLKHLNFDYVKIDGQFIRDLVHDETNQLVVRSVAQLARELGKRTIAEFVGDEATLVMLREQGIDYAQGFFIGRPVALEDVDLAAPLPSGVASTSLTV